LSDLPLVPAPRHFTPASGTVDVSHLALTEAVVTSLGFAPTYQPNEAYELVLAPQGARLTALSPEGLAHGRTTWKALLAAGVPLPAGTIQDEPRFGWRGLMLDCSRHFFPVSIIKDILDRLAELKLNRFHWHLVDDQGWRLEIPAYPRFTEVGAWRIEKNGTRYGGFYTAAEVAEVIAYAAERSIIVVPEIELPGHSLAALASYPQLSCSGAPEKVETQWGIFDGVYCASSEPALKILEDVLDEVCRQFPSPWIHIGGDEVIRDRWEACPRCQEKIRAEGLNGVAGLEAAFFHRFIAFLQARGKTPIGWNELFEHAIPQNVPVQWWHRTDLAQKTLETGNPLLVSDIEYCYYDYPYTENDPWYEKSFMKITPAVKVYQNPVVPQGCEAHIDRIWGGEACLWSERLEPHQWPQRLDGRIEAFAEVYWTFDRRPGWESFSRRLRKPIP
jgi:hexosaminidase